MTKPVLELIDILSRISAVKQSSLLTKDEQKVVLGEIKKSLPAPQLCRSCGGTYEIVSKLLTKEGVSNGRTQEPPTKGPETSGQVPQEVSSEEREEQLLPPVDADGRGQGAAPRVVNPTPQKRRATKGNT